MGRSKSSNRWLQEHFSDQFVKQSQKDGYRSRASYKLLEIQQKDHLIKPGMTVVDLGAAPGGWTQVAAELVGGKGKVVASDILPMDPVADVSFVQGDFTEDVVLEEILAAIGADRVDLVISDMAPNMSGMKAVDQPKAMYLAELALDLSLQVLKPKGCFLTKVFQGEGFDQYFKAMREAFASVVTRKPLASRSRSREVYLLGKGFKG
ncbi:23S rRNA (uridine(2552)-2'-O)-methyltransferase RlmE [Spartinivicinus poritis]|uniref:Ribosomal RNA large subunit methyltransferase E n=1 Tax=Spartinivicinus poritis TaxID=2994640 RepID=A0ABT5UA65_9GAMM|nr:23S rRNA (uridine(2552)-2'-O)-methyltransferase RlmE [Spartinivicinus sp. A2-2]MDE1463268.1 23S rRNA (uridine(2552)-2'-O)-methyltransferase RlmE [Spartinivicinus sp. A2-2]